MNRPATVYKPGRDVTVGDRLPLGPGGFLILGFADLRPGIRLGLNCWGEGIVVDDDFPTRVLGRAT
jgi:hypothetical protein